MSRVPGELYDPFDPELIADPYPVYTCLRNEHPAYWNERLRIRVLSRFEDVRAAVHDPGSFSSGHGVFVGRNAEEQASTLRTIMPMILEMDPPRHDQLRGLVSRAWTPRRIGALEGRIREISSRLIGDIDPSVSHDLVSSVAGVLPTVVIAELLGVPEEDWPLFRAWSTDLVQVDPDDPVRARRAHKGMMELYNYLARIVADRRRTGRDDLVTDLIAASDDGHRLDEAELMGFCVLLLIAGNETTTNLISNAAALLAAHPDQRRALARDQSGIGLAVEEFLRFDSPVQALGRQVTREVVLHGERLEEGERVVLLFGAANRDERVFSDPWAFNVTRVAGQHLAFGHGIHFCLGASLARLEARVMFEELLGRFPEYDIDVERAERLHAGSIRGFTRLPIQLGVRAA